jgi:hypothetical protein
LPQVVQGTLGRSEIEQQLKAKMAQIDAHMAQLKTLKKELAATFSAALRPPPASGRSPCNGTGQWQRRGVAVARRAFAKRQPQST